MKCVVVGGGVSGLAAAHRLTELAQERGEAPDLLLVEASGRLGGVIETEVRDGYVLEGGPDSMITDKPWGLALARRLGLDSELIGTQEQHRRSFVVHQGRLEPVPEGFQLLAPSRFGPLVSTRIFSWAGKARMALDLILPPRNGSEDESLGSFVTRRLGREALERIAQPMIAGIYGADPMKLSLQATLPRFLDMERQHGSVIRAMLRARARQAKAAPDHANSQTGVSGARYGLFVSFRNGMQTLTDALAQRLPAGAVRLHTRATHLARSEDRWNLTLAPGGVLEVDRVILALPAYQSASLVQPLDAELADHLSSIPYAASGTMSLAYREEQVPHPLDGFGFVTPSREGLTILGCTFTHRKYAHRAPAGIALLRAFLGEQALAGRDDAELDRMVREDLRRLLGITAAPLWTKIARHPRSMAQYDVGHLVRVAEMERRVAAFPGLALCGNGFRGIGIPDCVRAGEAAAEAIRA